MTIRGIRSLDAKGRTVRTRYLIPGTEREVGGRGTATMALDLITTHWPNAKRYRSRADRLVVFPNGGTQQIVSFGDSPAPIRTDEVLTNRYSAASLEAIHTDFTNRAAVPETFAALIEWAKAQEVR